MEAIIPLSELRYVDIARAGGKAASLGELISAGFPVPPGFCILTSAYWDFIAHNQLQETIQSLIRTVDLTNPGSTDSASQAIRALFERSTIPLDLADDILQAYHTLGESPPVAVRSSATAEDLPDLSFAGQQDTFLNVMGEEQLLGAVRSAWNSLWTARAIAYRLKNKVPQEEISLAVVVQVMVPSEVSGVLFTANPLTGKRGEIVIDAVFGLGEGLVSGGVEPDQYVINSSGELVKKSLGKKEYAVRGQPDGGVHRIEDDLGSVQALPDSTIFELAELGRRLQAHFRTPQDVEWAWVEGQLFIVQSRPITSLYPLPEGLPAEPLLALISFGALQGVLEPMTPLSQDLIKSLAVGLAQILNRKDTLESQRVFFPAGMRLFVNITPLLRNRLGRRLFQAVLGGIEPGTQPAVRAILDEPAFAPGKSLLSLATLGQVARLILPALARIPGNLIAPGSARRKARQHMDRLLSEVERRVNEAHTLDKLLDVVDYFMVALPKLMLYHMVPKFGPGVGLLNLLRRLATGLPGEETIALEITRGLPHNVTTEMDLELWKAAQVIRRDSASVEIFKSWQSRALAAAYQNGKLPAAAQSALDDFLLRYGFRGTGEIDVGRARWREEPEPVIEALQSYLEIRDVSLAPDEVFRRGAERALATVESLAEQLRAQPGGWFKAHLARFAADRIRNLVGLREMPKFILVQVLWHYRQGLLSTAKEMVMAGILERAEDIFFLNQAELRALAGLQAHDRSWPGTAAQSELVARAREKIHLRRDLFVRESTRRQVPRLLLTDGRVFFAGAPENSPAQSLRGDPVSPGMVEGVVRVVFDPRRADLRPGEILVCRGTDPSWTPLFLSAGGLVMEVGGLMTHGSVVAREYGIPAVVGVSDATQRLKTGQKIRLDGSTGRIEVI